MSHKILCAVYLLIAISTVHSASYYYRAGREVVVSPVEVVEEVISELKKDGPVVIDEIVAVAPVANVEPDVTIAETVVNSDEARAKQNPVLRLDTLEVIQAGGKSDKVTTVAETVKNAAVQAIENQNQEVAESVKADEVPTPVTKVEVASVDETPVVKSVPIIEPVEIKSEDVKVPEPVAPIVQEESAVPAIETVKELKEEKVVKDVTEVKEVKEVVESVRATVPQQTPASTSVCQPPTVGLYPNCQRPTAPAKPEVPIEEKKVEVPTIAVVEEPKPEIRQQTSETPNPIQVVQNAITQFTNNVQNLLANAPFIGNRPQSDTSAALNTNEVAAATPAIADATQAASPTTGAPNLIQQAITQISNQVNNILRPSTAAPAAPAPPVVSGTRGGDDSVEVVQNIDVVNDKVDLSKNTQ